MRFSYTARTKDGEPVAGALDAASQAEAELALVDRGFLAVTIGASGFRDALRTFVQQLQRPRTRDVVIFLRQFSVMVAAKVPLAQALRALVRSTVQPSLRAVLLDVARDVESGRKLSDAFRAHPRVFGPFAVHLTRAGETSGELEEVVGYLADQAEHDDELRHRIRGAMVYPAFILTGLAIVAIIMVAFVIPRLTSVLQESGAALPVATRALIATSWFTVTWGWLVLIAFVGGIAAFRWSLRTSDVRAAWDGVRLRLPILGPLLREIAVVRFARSFEVLLRGGVDMVPALEVVRDVVGNAAFARVVDETIREVRDGSPLTSVFARTPFIPPMVTQLLAVGEETGRVRDVLDRLATFYSREVDQRIRNLVTIIEPLIMIVMGIAVGVMVAAVILPMYNLASQF